MEIGQNRKAILKNWKKHLLSLKNRFQDYLSLLELEEKDITQGDFYKLHIHTEMEKQALDGIYSYHKVLEPLEKLYNQQSQMPGEQAGEGDREIADLQQAVEQLITQVKEQNRFNRRLLKESMEELEKERETVRRPFLKASQFTQTVPSFIDITT